jgi:hypothetical protein
MESDRFLLSTSFAFCATKTVHAESGSFFGCCSRATFLSSRTWTFSFSSGVSTFFARFLGAAFFFAAGFLAFFAGFFASAAFLAVAGFFVFFAPVAVVDFFALGFAAAFSAASCSLLVSEKLRLESTRR